MHRSRLTPGPLVSGATENWSPLFRELHYRCRATTHLPSGSPMSTASPAKLEIVPPAGPLRGSVTPPGSKSITNRALLVAALAKGESVLTGGLTSDDTRYMAEA